MRPRADQPAADRPDDGGVEISAEVNGGPFDGARTHLRVARQVGVRQQLWLAEVDGVWHAYQLIPIPDSETDRVFSHLGAVDTLPTLDPAS